MRGRKPRLIIALIVAAVAFISYYSNTQYNEITGEKQHISISPQQEIALGMQAQPQMVQQFGGQSSDAEGQERVDRIGRELVASTAAVNSPYQFDFHLLGDKNTVNAFALPGGQVFITEALYSRLSSDDELAGVLGHEIGHVIGRHSAERIAKQELVQGVSGAAVIASYDPNKPSTMQTAAVAAMISNLVLMKFGREDELESDDLGVRFMLESGYDPHALVRVMEVLEEASQGNERPEFLSTHPSPDNRIERIKESIVKYQQAGQSN